MSFSSMCFLIYLHISTVLFAFPVTMCLKHQSRIYLFLLNMSMVRYVIWAPALESMLFLPFLLPLGLAPETQTTKTGSRKHNPNPVVSTEEKEAQLSTDSAGLCSAVRPLCKLHPIIAKQAEKVRNLMMLVRNVFLRKALWRTKASPVSEQQVQLGCSSGQHAVLGCPGSL